MNIYFKNNTGELLNISGLGFNLEIYTGSNLYDVSEGFDFEKDLCGEESLLKLLKENKITVYIDNRELSNIEAVDMFTITSYLEDYENEK